MRRSQILAFLVAAVAACSSGDGDGGGDDAFSELVGRVPATAVADEGAMLQYVDMDLVWNRLGVGDDPEERLDNLGRTAEVETYAISPLLFESRAALVDEARSEVGFDVTTMRQEIAVDRPPDALRVVRVGVDAGTVESALESDPVWSDELETADADAGSYFDWSGGEEGRPDPSRTTPMRPLGIGGQLAVEPDGDDAVVTRTEDAAAMEAALATADGDAPSVADEGPLAPAFDAVGDGQVVQAVGLPGPLLFDPAQILGGTDDEAAVERIEELLAELPRIQPYEAILLVELVDGDAYRTELLVAYGDEAAAAANVEPIERHLAEGISTLTQQPLSELLPVTGVEQDGVVVRITLEGDGAFNGPFQALITGDVLTVRD